MADAHVQGCENSERPAMGVMGVTADETRRQTRAKASQNCGTQVGVLDHCSASQATAHLVAGKWDA